MNEFDITFDSPMIKQLQRNRKWFLALGICLVILGSLAVIFTFQSTLFSVLYLGILLMVFGAFEIIKALRVSLWRNFFLHMFLGALYLIGGFYIVSHPLLNALTLTLALAIFYVVSGVLKIMFAIMQPMLHKGWAIANGALTLLLGILIWQQWPSSGLWVIGMFVGIDAIITGWTWIMLSTAVKRLTPCNGSH